MSILPPHVADDYFGGTLLGVIATSALWGMACIQTYAYFNGSSQDRPIVRYSIGFLTIINALHTILASHMVYYYLITQYGNPATAARVVWSELTVDILTEIINIVIRVLYARRIWLLSKGNKWLVVAILGFAIPSFAFACATFAIILRLPDYSMIPNGGGIYYIFRWLGNIAFIFSSLSELSITFGMIYYLRKLRTSFSQTKTLVQALVKYAITTGLLAVLVPVTSQIISILRPLVTWSVMLYYCQGKLYFISYLAALNARETVTSNVSTSLQMSNLTGSVADRAVDSTPFDIARGVVVLQEVDTFVEGGGKDSKSRF